MLATDQQRSLFLKGFKLSDQGKYEDPTYLGFKIIFDFGVLPVRADDGLPPSPLFRIDSYENQQFFPLNPFAQPQYGYRSTPEGNIAYYSATSYLREREANFPRGGKRADMLIQFRNLLNDLNTNSPWFFQSIEGLDQLEKVVRPGFATQSEGTFNPQRTANKILTFNTLEALNLRMTALSDLYNQATFDYDNMRELIPRNLRKFTMYIFVQEIRNFFKTSRLIGSSAALTSLNNLSDLLGSGNNPGSNLGAATNVANQFGQEFGQAVSGGGGPLSSFVGNVFNNAGLNNDFSLLQNQQDQSGIKPMIIYECRNCEFDFTDSTPIPSSISVGADTATPVTQSFKVLVGKVRKKSQYPNIRQDQKPLILADSWDGARSSVEKNPEDVNDFLSIGEDLLTNFISNSLNDLINEGISNYVLPAIAGADKLALGNIYSFDPGQVLGRLSFNSAQSFLDQLGNVNAGLRETILPNPQSTGLGGPPERVYPPPSGDVYTQVPGRDLGVPERVYAQPSGDAYTGVPGRDLGVPGRVYVDPSGDAYPGVPGADLGVPDRVYQLPRGDVYPGVPGPDLGVPDRVYPPTSGDVYPEVPGRDLGVPDRVYPPTTGDAYPDVPGRDLGVPGRVYPAPTGDEYGDVPGRDLGVPTRAYPPPGGDVYSNVPGNDLGVPDRAYPAPQGKVYPENEASRSLDESKVYPDFVPSNPLNITSQRVYTETPKVSYNGELRDESNTFSTKPPTVYPAQRIPSQQNRGDIGKVYPQTTGDFIVEKPINLGNLKPADKYNISLGQNNPDPNQFED